MLLPSLLYHLQRPLQVQSLVLYPVHRPESAFAQFSANSIMLIECANSAHNEVLAVDTQPLLDFELPSTILGVFVGREFGGVGRADLFFWWFGLGH